MSANQFKYQLEPYKGPKTRFHCPACSNKEKTFSRYINVQTGEYLAPFVGRCNRETNCGYHYTPKEYFRDIGQPWKTENLVISTSQNFDLPFTSKQTSSIPAHIFQESLKYPSQNNFIKYLLQLFGSRITEELVNKYRIGSSKHWPGSTVFWQVDQTQKIRSGKVILYDCNTCKRVKEPYNHIAWAHTLLGLVNFNLRQCFFGEHLLLENSKNPVAIVESEKTAIIASVYMPQLIWLASGGINNLSVEKCKVLSGRRILIFPDLKGFRKWQHKVVEIQDQINCKISISNILEANASKDEKNKGLDIADFLVKRDAKFGWALSANNYPLFWDK